MTDRINLAILQWADRLPGDALWEVIPGQFTEPSPVCRAYQSATEANTALERAGYGPTGRAIPSPPLGAVFDPRTVMRYGKSDPHTDGVLLVRRFLARRPLTDDHFDYMDCRPGGNATGINYTPPWMKRTAAEKEKRRGGDAGKPGLSGRPDAEAEQGNADSAVERGGRGNGGGGSSQ